MKLHKYGGFPECCIGQSRFSSINKLRSEDILCDVILVAVPNAISSNIKYSEPTKSNDYLQESLEDSVEGIEIEPAHKIVLAACSDYFNAMFSHDGITRESRQYRIAMHDIDAPILSLIVDYMYTGCIEIRDDTVEKILATANLLQMGELVNAASRFMASRIDASNCCGIRTFADVQGCQPLLHFAQRYIIENFIDVINHREFLSLNHEHLQEILVHDEVCVHSEDEILTALMKWIYHDLPGRKCHFPSLLQCVRMRYLSHEAIKKLLAEPMMLDTTNGSDGLDFDMCRRLLIQAFLCQNSWVENSLLPPPTQNNNYCHRIYDNQSATKWSQKARKGTFGLVLAIGGNDKQKNPSGMEIYDFRCNVWTALNTLNPNNTTYNSIEKSSVTLNDNVNNCEISIPNNNDGLMNVPKLFNSKPIINPPDHSLNVHLPQQLSKRVQFGAVLCEGLIYVVGGRDGFKTLSSMMSFNPVESCCLHTASHNSISHKQDNIFFQNSNNSAKMNRKDLRSSYEFIRVNESENNCGNNNHNNTLSNYELNNVNDNEINGINHLRSTSSQLFDLGDWEWSSAMITPRHGLGVCVLTGLIYAIGGHDGWSYLNTVERFDPQYKTWNFVASMNCSRSTVAVISLGNYIYAMGGRDGTTVLRSVERYDLTRDKWITLAPMNEPRSCAGAATINGYIYVAGGHKSVSNMLNSATSIYNATGSDSQQNGAALNLENNCYGRNRARGTGIAAFSRTVEKYDPETNTWTFIAKMRIPRDALGFCALGQDYLLAVGGFDGVENLYTAECYDPCTDEWNMVASLNIGRAGSVLICIPPVWADSNKSTYDIHSTNDSINYTDDEFSKPLNSSSLTHFNSNIPEKNVDPNIFSSGEKMTPKINFGINYQAKEYCKSHNNKSNKNHSRANTFINISNSCKTIDLEQQPMKIDILSDLSSLDTLSLDTCETTNSTSTLCSDITNHNQHKAKFIAPKNEDPLCLPSTSSGLERPNKTKTVKGKVYARARRLSLIEQLMDNDETTTLLKKK